MKTTRLMGVAAMFSCSCLAADAAKLYWDGGTNDIPGSGNGASAGATGIWDAVTLNWDQGDGLPLAAWTNSGNDTAVFGGSAGFVTLGAAITAGGLQFDTTGYNLSNGLFVLTFGAATNRLILNNVAAATVGGTVGGTGDVVATAANPAVAGTLTFRGVNTNGWSGATTVSPGTTLLVDNNAGTNRALMNTSAIAIEGGSLLVQNILSAQAGVDFVNDSASIAFDGGGTFGWRPINAGPTFAETGGVVTVNSGQASLLTGTISSGLATLVLPGIVRNDVSSVLVFSLANGGPLTSVNRIQVTGAGTTAGWTNGAASNPIVGPWATSGNSGTADYAVYNNDLVTPANVAASAESTWADAALAFTVTNGATLTAGRQTYALRAIGVAQTLNLGGFNLETHGLLNGGGGALVVTNGVLTTSVGGGAGTTNDLFVTTASANITTHATLADNGAAVRVVKSGGNMLQLAGANAYSGGTVLNAGTLAATSDANLGATTGGVIVNGAVTLNRPGTGSFSFHPDRTFTINRGATLIFTSGNSPQTIAGRVTGAGNLYLNATTSLILSNANNDFTGTLSINSGGNTGYGLDIHSIDDSPGVGQINLGVGNGGGTFRWFGSSGATRTLVNRQFVLSGTTGGGVISGNGAASADNLVVQRDLLIAVAGNKTLTLAGTNTGINTFAGNIADVPGSTIGLTKALSGTWALSGTNTYSGATQISQANPNGTLVIQGRQALSPNTTVTMFQNSTPASTLRLLDDTPGLVGLPNTLTINHANAVLNIVVFVGNNGTANGGSNPGSTNTGSVIALNRLNFTGLNNAQPLVGFRVEGADGYGLGLNGVEFPAFPSNTITSMSIWTARLIANSAGVTITGTVQQLAGSTATNALTFSLDGTNTGNSISGAIRDSADDPPRPLFVTKTSSSTWTLSGSNAFSGGLTLSGAAAGSQLNIDGPWALGTGTFTLSGGNNGRLGNTSGGAVTNANNNPMTWNSDFTFVGSNDLDLGTGPVTMGGNRGITVSAGTLTVGGAIGAAGFGITKSGVGRLVLGGTNTYGGTTTVGGGTLLVNGEIGTNRVTVTSGTLGGRGICGGSVSNRATVAPGASVGALTVGGDYLQTESGALQVELGGTTPGSGHDVLVVSNTATLAGTLQVTLTNGYAGVAGNSFTVLTAAAVGGTFATTNLPALGGGNGWNVEYLAGAVVLAITNAGGPPPATGYDAFSNLHVLAQGPEGDDDGDGFANLYEYVTGSNPTNSGSNASLSAARTNGFFALRFTRDTNSVDATLLIEAAHAATNDAVWNGIATNLLGSWGAATNVVEGAGNPASVTVFDSEPAATNRFLRLRITRP